MNNLFFVLAITVIIITAGNTPYYMDDNQESFISCMKLMKKAPILKLKCMTLLQGNQIREDSPRLKHFLSNEGNAQSSEKILSLSFKEIEDNIKKADKADKDNLVKLIRKLRQG